MTKVQNESDIPAGIPKFQPSLANGIISVFSKRKFHAIDFSKAPYELKDLAWHAARCESLKHYRAQFHYILTIMLFGYLSLIQTGRIYSGAERLNWWNISDDISAAFLFSLSFLGASLTAIALLIIVIALCYSVIKNNMELLTNGYKTMKTDLFKFDQHRTAIYFLAILIPICSYLWLAHVMLDTKFTVSGEDYPRLLSGFEFLYFFFVTFTTLGFGDIIPYSNGAKSIVLIINAMTLFSIITWFNAISARPRKGIIKAQIYHYFKEHLKHLKTLNKYAHERVMTGDKNEMCAGKVICPAHKVKEQSTHCEVCNNAKVVEPDVAVTYATWPKVSGYKFLANIMGLSRKELKEIVDK